MCYIVVERYQVCRCLYYKHNIDMCPAYGQQGHAVAERTLLVGTACPQHSGSIFDLKKSSQSTKEKQGNEHRQDGLQGDEGMSSSTTKQPDRSSSSSRKEAYSGLVDKDTSGQEPEVTSNFQLLQLLPSTKLKDGKKNASQQKASPVAPAVLAISEDKKSSKILAELSRFDGDMNSYARYMRHGQEGLVSKASPFTWSDITEKTTLTLLSEEKDPPPLMESNSPSGSTTLEDLGWTIVDKPTDGDSCRRDDKLDLNTAPAPHGQPLLDRLLRPDEHFESLRVLEEEIFSYSSSIIYSSKRLQNLRLYYPDLLPDLANGMPEALPDKHITALCVSYGEQTNRFESLQSLYKIRDCRNAIAKTYLNLRRLQQANFCTDSFSLIVVDPSRPVACLRSVKIIQVLQLVWRVEFILRQGANLVCEPDPPFGNSEYQSRLLPLIETWCNLLLPTGMERRQLDFITTLRLLVHMLDLSVISCAGAHLNNFMERYLEKSESRIDLLAPYAESESYTGESVVLQQCSLQCLDSFHNNTPIWAFTPSSWKYEKPLCLSTNIETFADIWGPLWKEKTTADPNKFSAYVVGNGAIVPWKRHSLDPQCRDGETFCHWVSDDDWDDNELEISANNVAGTSSSTGLLLIGAQVGLHTGKQILEVNSTCSKAISAAREHLKDSGRLSVLGTSRPMRYNDGTQYQLQLGYSGVNAAISKQYKRVPAKSLKDVLIELWAMQADIRSPALLDDLYGLEVSMCTFNAQRVSLSKILGLNCLQSYLQEFDWKDMSYQTEYRETLKDTSRRTRSKDEKFKDAFDRAVMLCLKALSKTGVNQKEDLQVFLSSKCTPKPELATLTPKEHTWIAFLRDTTRDCTMAAFGDSCLGFKEKSGVTCGGTGRSVLRTALIPNSIEKSLSVIKVTEQDCKIWSARWDVSSLKVRTPIWLGERGTLVVVAHLNDDTLLTEWRSSPATTAMKYLMSKEQPHREFAEVDHSGEQATRPIPVFVMSRRVALRGC